jgi:lysozyme family protein
MNFESFIDDILAAEQGYVDHPADRGGPTCWGITVAVARRNGYQGEMRELPIGLAREIYRRRYIVDPCFDKVALIDEAVGFELIDTGVNMGPARAAEFLQRCLNVFNAQGSRYPDLFVDGRIGQVTLDALRAFLRWRGEKGVQTLLKALNCVQGARYIEIAENNPSQESFAFGWFQRVELAQAKT